MSMAIADKEALVSTLINDSSITTSVIDEYLALSSDRIIKKCYPFGTGTETMPEKYDRVQCELAARMILRRGAEGERIHNENGIKRTYETVDDEDILCRVTQIVGVV